MTNLNKLIEQRQEEVESKSQHEEWGGWKIVSDMLDKPNEYGIFPTSECYERLHDFVVEQKIEAYRQALLDLRAGLPLKLSNEVAHRYPNDYAFEIGHDTALQTVRAQIEGLLGKIEQYGKDK